MLRIADYTGRCWLTPQVNISACSCRFFNIEKANTYNRAIPVLPSHVTEARTDHARTRREANPHLTQCDTAIARFAISMKKTEQCATDQKIYEEIQSLWPHLLPSHVASLLTVMARKNRRSKEDNALVERLASRFERFSDAKSFWRALVALKTLEVYWILTVHYDADLRMIFCSILYTNWRATSYRHFAQRCPHCASKIYGTSLLVWLYYSHCEQRRILR